jgi:HK97 family phage major capsid protein
MKKITVTELQKNLQNLANQVGAKNYEVSKALVLQDLIITDTEGNVVDPSTIDYSVELMPMGEDEVPAVELETPKGNSSKSIAAEVAKAVRAELATTRNESPIKPTKVEYVTNSRVKNFANAADAFRFGSWAMACLGNKKSANWCHANGIITKDHLEGSNSLGGFTVPDEFSSTLINLRETFGVARQNATVVPMSSDVIRVPRRNGNLTAYFIGEGAIGTESTQSFDQVNLVAKKAMVLSQISSELSEDNIVGLGDGMAAEMSYAISYLEDGAAFIGDGTSTYGGIQGLATAVGSAGVSTATSNNFAAITQAQVRTFMGLLPQYADTTNCKFYMHRVVFNSVCQRLAEAAGGASVVEIGNGASTTKFLGYPVVLCQRMNSTSSSGGVAMHFGDFSQAVLLGSRRDLTVSFSDSALNGFESDLITVRTTCRFDINCANVGSASAAGSIVTLKAGGS